MAINWEVLGHWGVTDSNNDKISGREKGYSAEGVYIIPQNQNLLQVELLKSTDRNTYDYISLWLFASMSAAEHAQREHNLPKHKKLNLNGGTLLDKEDKTIRIPYEVELRGINISRPYLLIELNWRGRLRDGRGKIKGAYSEIHEPHISKK